MKPAPFGAGFLNSMGLILCLETSTTQCSVGLARDGQLLLFKEENSQQYKHSEWLHSFIQELLQEAQVKIGELHAVAVGKGPGSYTGLRIGVSAAKGLCFAQDLKLIALPTLDVLARQVQVQKGVIIPLLDARRMEVYSKVLDPLYNEIRSTQAEIIDAHSFEEYKGSGAVLIGPGAEKCRAELGERHFDYNTEALPSAREMAALAEEYFRAEQFENLAYFEPYYLKDFVLQKPKSKN